MNRTVNVFRIGAIVLGVTGMLVMAASPPAWSEGKETLQVVVASVGSNQDGQPVVLLQAQDSERVLPIFIGPNEAVAIAMEMAHLRPPRPMTHDLLKNTIEALGGRVNGIVITALREGTFFATVEIERDGRLVTIDARPSDSIALALRCAAPIAVDAELFRRESIPAPPGSPESDEPDEPETPARPAPRPPARRPDGLTI